jgi:acyl carrier protein
MNLDMNIDPQVMAEVMKLLGDLTGDWDYEGEVGPSTRFLADFGMESLDLVVLGTTLQSRYGTLPFAEFLAALGRRPVEDRDVTVAELVEFITRHRVGSPSVVGEGARP